ncbi:hypothetical protein KW794_02540 [Candidatus Saccharibacteria bacterium]|nr:hypothetical protein [Candidatus Saccharibacteria bacterium]
MVTKSEKSPQRSKLVKLEIVLPIILLIVVGIFMVWYNNNNSKTPGETVQAGWSEYKVTKYGFKFSYPTSWKAPQLVASKGKTGNQYQAIFGVGPQSNPANKNLSVVINLQSEDYVSTLCPANCESMATSKFIQTNLKSKAANFIEHDDSSYAFIASIPTTKTSTLTDVQIINLANLKVTGAVGVYTMRDVTDCPQAKFATSSKGGCITHAHYDTLSKVLKSIEAV